MNAKEKKMRRLFTQKRKKELSLKKYSVFRKCTVLLKKLAYVVPMFIIIYANDLWVSFGLFFLGWIIVLGVDEILIWISRSIEKEKKRLDSEIYRHHKLGAD